MQTKIRYAQGYLEFPEILNTNLSEDLEYHFEFSEITETVINMADFSKIDIQKAQNCIYKWFIKEIDASYHEAFWSATETLLDIIEIEILQNEEADWFLWEDDQTSEIRIQMKEHILQIQLNLIEKNN